MNKNSQAGVENPEINQTTKKHNKPESKPTIRGYKVSHQKAQRTKREPVGKTRNDRHEQEKGRGRAPQQQTKTDKDRKRQKKTDKDRKQKKKNRNKTEQIQNRKSQITL